MDTNCIILTGRLCADPEIKTIPSGTSVTTLRVASSRAFTSGNEKREETVYVDVQAWGREAENCCEYLRKGSRVCVQGQLCLDEWERDGQKRQKHYVKATPGGVQFLDGAKDRATTEKPTAKRAGAPQGEPAGAGRGAPLEDDDIPF